MDNRYPSQNMQVKDKPKSKHRQRKLNDQRYGRGHDYSIQSYYGQHFLDNWRDETPVPYRDYNHPDWDSPGPYTGIGPRGYQRSDERLYEEVYERLKWNGMVNVEDVAVQVKSGVVRLTGTVDSLTSKRMINDVVDMTPGVQEIENELRVRRER